jgi:putative Mg2+ transporter-C (MgtC) family protein
MNWIQFGIRMFAALFFGGVIGLERQWRQRMIRLRTNGLVAVGSAMFIMMGGLIAGEGSQGRVAATLWCTAAVGTLAGLGPLSRPAMS